MDGGVDELLTGPEFQWLNQWPNQCGPHEARARAEHLQRVCVRVRVTRICIKIDDHRLICFISENSLFIMQLFPLQNKSIFIRLM